MTDNEIIKALECCIESDCDNCPWHEQTACNEYMKQDALDLINRQKAEIERLDVNLKEAFEEIEALKQINIHCKAEAIKEFAERLSEKAPHITEERFLILRNEIDKLVKETVGAKK